MNDLLDETLLWLCAIDSPIGEEKALCDAVEKRLADGKKKLRARRYGNSIVVPFIRKGGTRKHIGLIGHLDTVRTENGPAKMEDGRCFGAGASDMKSGLAVMLALAETVDDLPCDVTLVFYAREEGPFVENELGPVLEADQDLATLDLAVCLEPSDNKLHLGCGGSLHAELTFVGRTAHSARPWEGENAVTKAGAFLSELAARAPEPVEISGLTYRSVFTVTQAKDGGRGRNVVPDRFLLNLNHRFAPTFSVEESKARLVALVAGRAEIRFTDESPAAMPYRDNPLVELLVAAGVRDIAPKQAWTDVARFSARGIAAVNFGPGENAQAHQKNESTNLALVHEGFAIVRRWLESVR